MKKRIGRYLPWKGRILSKEDSIFQLEQHKVVNNVYCYFMFKNTLYYFREYPPVSSVVHCQSTIRDNHAEEKRRRTVGNL